MKAKSDAVQMLPNRSTLIPRTNSSCFNLGSELQRYVTEWPLAARRSDTSVRVRSPPAKLGFLLSLDAMTKIRNGKPHRKLDSNATRQARSRLTCLDSFQLHDSYVNLRWPN